MHNLEAYSANVCEEYYQLYYHMYPEEAQADGARNEEDEDMAEESEFEEEGKEEEDPDQVMPNGSQGEASSAPGADLGLGV